MTYEIEKNVPVPTVKAKYPFASMDPDDSFLVPLSNGEDVAKVEKRMRGACTWAQKKFPGKKFIARRDSSGVRVWRVA